MSDTFLVDINPNLELPKYKVTLCKLNEEPLMELENIDNKVYKSYFIDIDEFSFTVPKYIQDNGKTIKNYIYDYIEGDFLILLNNAHYFYIDNVKEMSDGDGIEYKQVHSYSREFMLKEKIVRGYILNSRKLYDYANSKDENGYEIGIMNYVEKICSWKVGYINTDLLEKYRSFNVTEANLLQLFQEIQKTFDCVFQYDTINKTINIYKMGQLGQNKGLYITDENYIKSITKNNKHEEIVTRLYLYGKDNVSIQSINVTGQPYIENYDYYKNTKFMSQGLIDGLNNYENFIETKQGEFNNYLSQLDTLQSELGTKNDELVVLQTELKTIEQNIDIAIADGQSIEDLNTQKSNKENEIEEKLNEINNLENQINAIYENIDTLRNEIQIENFLNEEQINEFDTFIKEDAYSDADYTENNLEELLEKGIEILDTVSQPSIQFDIDVVDFLNLIECQHDWDKLVKGDIINIVHSGLNIDVEMRLIGYEHDEHNNGLTLTFSNRNNLDDPNYYERDLISQFKTISSTVDFSRFSWDKAEEVNNAFSQYVNSELDLSNQAISKASGQKPIIDERGLWLYKLNEDGTINPEQIRAINNVIALTKDNWNTVDVAITPNGVLAQKLIGNIILGSNLKIIGDNGILEILGNLLTVKDNQDKIRVLLGEYTEDKFGLLLKDSSGNKTILDEDGILQTWQEGRADNVDNSHPLTLNIYIPSTTKIINQAILRFKRMKFRAYSTGAASGGGIEETTSTKNFAQITSSTKNSEVESTSSGGGGTRTTSSGGGTERTTSSAGKHKHLIATHISDSEFSESSLRPHKYAMVKKYGTVVQFNLPTTETYGDDLWTDEDYGYHNHEVSIPSHSHSVTIPEHTHSVTIPSHNHTIQIPSHNHEIEIPNHTHEIEYGIYEDTLPSNITIKINGVDRTIELGGVFNDDQNNIDITQYIIKGQWNTIDLGSSTLGRIDATIFIQALMGVN